MTNNICIYEITKNNVKLIVLCNVYILILRKLSIELQHSLASEIKRYYYIVCFFRTKSYNLCYGHKLNCQ